MNVAAPYILQVEGLTVSFDGFKALNDLSFTVAEGELTDIARLDQFQLAAHGLLDRDGTFFGIGSTTTIGFYTFGLSERELTVHFDPTGWFRRADGRLAVSINDQSPVSSSCAISAGHVSSGM